MKIFRGLSWMLTEKIRRKFLEYFKSQEHAILPSSPVVPHNDPTILFNNAGMNQFKDIFLGKQKASYPRVTTSQKCVRVGGKHNDLENVGHTSRHLTFFEMLGNFSFGDYFKKEAICFGWQVATEVFQFEPEKIWISVFREDDEAYELWKAHVSQNRIVRMDEKDNFWAMGDTGPCGPCSELYYDRGSAYGNASSMLDDEKGERYIEFWNLVFMQFNRQLDGSFEELPNKCVDTGAGIERVVGLKLGVDSVFETDILKTLIHKMEHLAGVAYDPKNKHSSPAFHVIADHLRTLSFAIADGVQPSNVDRGYVLRKVLRRAVRYGRLLKQNDPFLAKLVPVLVNQMGEAYPELKINQSRIQEILTLEEEAFLRTLKRGGNLLNQVVEEAEQSTNKIISGQDAFKLKDTYGMPLEEILLVGKDSGLQIDIQQFEKLEQEAKMRSKQSQKEVHQIAEKSLYEDFVKQHGPTVFVGYQSTREDSEVVGILHEGQFVSSTKGLKSALIILNKTPFYAEMGGQIGDSGSIEATHAYLRVTDTQSPFTGLVVHEVEIERGSIALGDIVRANVDSERRQKIANNHTATHLLHWALQKVLGPHVRQAGSVVEPNRLRFDFNHHKALTKVEIEEIENKVNEKIRQNFPVNWYEIPFTDIQKRSDIKQFFGDKYGEIVRVVDIDFSKELCGGTHTSHTGNIGYFRILKEGSIAAGVRRIEAVSGYEAEMLARTYEANIDQLAEVLKIDRQKVVDRVCALIEENKQTQKEVKRLQKASEETLINSLLQKKQSVSGYSLIISVVEMDPKQLREFSQELLDKLHEGILVLVNCLEDKSMLVIRVASSLTKRISAVNMVQHLAPLIEGKGGGKPDFAQAGGKKLSNYESIFEQTKQYIQSLC